jgi:biotin carboxylase
MTTKKSKKNIVLFTGKINNEMIEAINNYAKEYKRKFRIGFLHDYKAKPNKEEKKLLKNIDLVISCNTNSAMALQKAILPYRKEILSLICRGDAKIPLFNRITPHLPYIKTSTTESLNWAIDKIWMRRRFFIHNKKITPPYTIVTDTDKKSLQRIENKVGFPLVVKPTGLGASRLVSICYHKEELRKTLKKVFKTIKKVYKKNKGELTPRVLVEGFMDGEMYSIDCYVNSLGRIYFCPMVHVITGKAIGFDDFFGYRQITPTLLKKEKIEQAQKTSTEAIRALALRSTTVHIELMRTENGWKVIELGPRIGGFRHKMYELSYGINHTMNDVKIHIPEIPKIPKKRKGYTAAMKFFAKKEGVLTKMTGIKKLQDLKSFQEVSINKKIGDKCKYAKNGGSSVFNIILFNKERSKLLADIRRLEQMIKICTK